MNITKEAIELAHAVGLGQDAKDNVLLVSIRLVLWKLPRGWRGILPDGFKQLVPGAAGAKGPWTGERLLGLGELGADRSSGALAQTTLKVLSRALGGTISDDVKKKALFWTADNASDEISAHADLKAELPFLIFDAPDDAHSIMLAIKKMDVKETRKCPWCKGCSSQTRSRTNP